MNTSSGRVFGVLLGEAQREQPLDSRTGTSFAGRFVVLVVLLGMSGCQGCRSESEIEPATEESAREDEPESVPDRVEVEQSSGEIPNNPIAAPSAKSSTSSDRPDREAGGESAGEAPAAVPAQTKEEALAGARRLHRRSQSAQANGDYGVAFRDASRAWSTLRPFRSDPNCGALCDAIEAELKELGRAANRQVQEQSFDGRTLIEK